MNDQPADLGRAGEGDLVDAVVRRKRGARVTEAGHDVEHARGDPRLEDQLAETQRRQRRLLGGLSTIVTQTPTPGPASRRHQQREVPRDDLRDHAHRLTHAKARKQIRRGDVRPRDRVALDLRRPPRHVMEQVGGQGTSAALASTAACRCRASPAAQLLRVLEDQIADPMDDLRARRRHRRQSEPRHQSSDEPPRRGRCLGRQCATGRDSPQ